MTIPLVILAVASAVIGGALFWNHTLAEFLAATPSLAADSVRRTAAPHAFHWDIAFEGSLATLIGIVIAAIGYYDRRSDAARPAYSAIDPRSWLTPLFANKFYLDEIYAAVVVRPLEWLAGLAAGFDRHVIDGAVDAVGGLPGAVGGLVRRSQSGLLQRYALAGVFGVLSIVVLLAYALRG